MCRINHIGTFRGLQLAFVAAKAGIEDILSYICHSPELRIDLPLYIIKGGTAEETISSIGGESKGITELIDSIRSAMEHRGDGNVFTAAEILGNTERNGSALVCAIEYAPSSEKAPEEGEEELSRAGQSRCRTTSTVARICGQARERHEKRLCSLNPPSSHHRQRRHTTSRSGRKLIESKAPHRGAIFMTDAGRREADGGGERERGN